MNHAMWIGMLALMIGAFVRALKTDGASALLSRLSGRDVENGDEPVRIPTRVLPFVALVAGAIAAVLDAYVGGASVEDALGAGVMAAASAVFGHELLSGVPGIKRILSVAFLLIAMRVLSACTPGARWAVLETFAEMSACAIANMNLPEDQIFLKCGARAVEDQERLRRIVGTAREEAASQAAGAYARGVVDAKLSSGTPGPTPCDR